MAAPGRRPVAVLARRRTGRARAAGVTVGVAPVERRRHRGALDREPQAGVAAPQGAPRPRGARPEADDPRPRPRHRVRGRRVPEPVRVLVRRHGDVHGARRALHAGLRVLPRRHQQARPAGGRRARAGRRGHRPDGARSRGADDGRPRRPARRWDGPRRGVRRGDPPPPAGRPRRDAGVRRQGRRRVVGGAVRRRGRTCSTTTSRPSPGCSGRCGRRPGTPAACRCSPGPRRPG